MYSTVLDLGRFVSVLFAEGARRGQVLSARSLEEMWTPQFAARGARTGFGLGFDISSLDAPSGRHGGAIYGFATELAALPDDSVGVVVAITKDGTNAVAERIASAAIRLMLAAAKGRASAEPQVTSATSLGLARRLEGSYGQGARRVDVVVRDSMVYLTRTSGMARSRLRLLAGDTLVVDDELSFGPRVRLIGQRLIVGNDTLTRPREHAPRTHPTVGEGSSASMGGTITRSTFSSAMAPSRAHRVVLRLPTHGNQPDSFAFPLPAL
jgi:hypothetical protein